MTVEVLIERIGPINITYTSEFNEYKDIWMQYLVLETWLVISLDELNDQNINTDTFELKSLKDLSEYIGAPISKIPSYEDVNIYVRDPTRLKSTPKDFKKLRINPSFQKFVKSYMNQYYESFKETYLLSDFDFCFEEEFLKFIRNKRNIIANDFFTKMDIELYNRAIEKSYLFLLKIKNKLMKADLIELKPPESIPEVVSEEQSSLPESIPEVVSEEQSSLPESIPEVVSEEQLSLPESIPEVVSEEQSSLPESIPEVVRNKKQKRVNFNKNKKFGSKKEKFVKFKVSKITFDYLQDEGINEEDLRKAILKYNSYTNEIYFIEFNLKIFITSNDLLKAKEFAENKLKVKFNDQKHSLRKGIDNSKIIIEGETDFQGKKDEALISYSNSSLEENIPLDINDEFSIFERKYPNLLIDIYNDLIRQDKAKSLRISRYSLKLNISIPQLSIIFNILKKKMEFLFPKVKLHIDFHSTKNISYLITKNQIYPNFFDQFLLDDENRPYFQYLADSENLINNREIRVEKIESDLSLDKDLIPIVFEKILKSNRFEIESREVKDYKIFLETREDFQFPSYQDFSTSKHPPEEIIYIRRCFDCVNCKKDVKFYKNRNLKSRPIFNGFCFKNNIIITKESEICDFFNLENQYKKSCLNCTSCSLLESDKSKIFCSSKENINEHGKRDGIIINNPEKFAINCNFFKRRK